MDEMKETVPTHEPSIADIIARAGCTLPDGRGVHFRKRFPLREWDHLVQLFNAIEGERVESNVPVLMELVESWDLSGDPKVEASYRDLDTLDEFLPMVAALGEYVRAKLKRAGIEKN